MPDFNNTENAFEDKDDFELKRAYLLFSTIKSPLISKTLTSLLKFALFLKLPIIPLVKLTIYKQFCGGETINQSQSTIDKLWNSKIGTILDYSAEGKKDERDFIQVFNQTLKSLKVSKNKQQIPFAVFKLTGISSFSLLQKINLNLELNIDETLEHKKLIDRVDKICSTAKECNTPIFIDAEESWIQDTIDNIALKMIQKYNKDEVLIYNTVQLYRHDRLDYIKNIIKQAKEKKFKIGLKIVRGAYHEKEIQRSKTKNYKCPVHIKKSQTDLDYNKAIEICLENISIISICAGTHNENSTLHLVNLMSRFNIKNTDHRIYFSQLLGMSDHISYNLSKEGFNTSKYVPYGPVKDVMPYLIRRAEENTSISGQMGRELTNIISEIKRRKKK